MADVSDYEVRCPRCDVSFPTGTKKCLHCGGATGPSRGPRGRIRVAERPVWREAEDAPDMRRFGPDQTTRAEPIDLAGDEDEATPRMSGLLRGIATVVWIMLAIGIALAERCSGGG